MTSNLPEAEEEERFAQTRLEESFTIILGTSNTVYLYNGSVYLGYSIPC